MGPHPTELVSLQEEGNAMWAQGEEITADKDRDKGENEVPEAKGHPGLSAKYQ